MDSTIGRLQSLRLKQRAEYHDLVRQAGRAEVNGDAFSDPQLVELDELARRLGVGESGIGKDVGHARQFTKLGQRLVGAAETRADAASKTAHLEGELAEAKKSLERLGPRKYGDPKDHQMLDSQIAALQRELQDQRSRIGRIESDEKTRARLICEYPWLGVGMVA